MSMKMVVIPYDRYIKLVKQNDKFPNNDLEETHVESEKRMKLIPSTSNQLTENIKTNNPISQNSSCSNQPTENIKINKLITENSKDYSSSKDMLDEDDILEYIPKNSKNKTKLIMKHMKKNCMDWDPKGQLILGDECVEKSHIVDLLKDITCLKKEAFKNINSVQLNKLLLNTHCPKSILNNSLS